MRDDLLTYYERELAFVRQMGAEFAQKYPKIASRLLLEPDKCEDPHVERMIEAFAFLAARVHLKIDDEFPEITESLLNVLYPHYLAPIPSLSIVQFALDPEQGKLTTGYHIPRDTALYSRPIQGTPCRFRACYPVTLWPVEVAAAALESLDPVDTRGRWQEAVLRIKLRCVNNTKLSELKTGEGDSSGSGDNAPRPIERLRFYLSGEPQLTYALYEMIFNNATRVELRSEGKRAPGRAAPAVITLPPSSLKPVGFAPDEGLLPYTRRSFAGYRLLTEYFTFPEKFLFFDLTGLDEAVRRGGFGEEFSVSIFVRDVQPPRALVSAATFQLGCAPVVNLFRKVAEPIQLTQLQHEYRVVPDVHRQMATEVYSVDSVSSTDPYLKQSRQYEPFYSIRHAESAEREQTFWYASRRLSPRKDDAGTEIYLSLVDLGFNPRVPAVETVTATVTASNRDLPAKLPFGGRDGDFEVEGTGPLARARCLRKPTPTVRPPLRRGAQWRLISHLSVNHLSIMGDADGGGADGAAADALREILSLYDFTDSPATRRQIRGITGVAGRRVVRQTGSRVGAGFVRGLETTVEFDEEMFVGSGVYLFSSVLERFLALYATANSFNQLVAKTAQREEVLKRWPPRAGHQAIL
ncbi:MAG TPA: type VI secretion system baseplate subunit TssF [Pyrinomonadaceae bacterium]